MPAMRSISNCLSARGACAVFSCRSPEEVPTGELVEEVVALPTVPRVGR